MAVIGTPARRILMLLGWYYPDSIGGTERYTRMLARDLRDLGYRLIIAAPSVDETPRHDDDDGIPVYRYPLTAVPSLPELRGEESPQYLATFTQWLQEQRPDLVHMHSFSRGCGFYHAQAVKTLGFPLCLTVHVPGVTCATGTMRRWHQVSCDGAMRVARCTACLLHDKGVPRVLGYAATQIPTRLLRAAGCWQNRLTTGLRMAKLIKNRQTHVHMLFTLADHIVVVSQWLYEVLRRNGVTLHNLTLSRHGLSQEALRPPTPHPLPQPSVPLRVGYVGRFHPTKGVQVLVEAAKRLPASTPVTLHLYGTATGSEERQYLAAVRKQSEGDTRIAFAGEMTEQNRQNVFESFDILAVPSLWLETGPLVALEAFAAGLPVIGSDSGGLAELVTPEVNGILVQTGNVNAWTQALGAMSERWRCGAWTWHLPPVRKSVDVALDMQRVYEDIWAKRRERR